MASETTALPLSASTTYVTYGDEPTWDGKTLYGCVCDSSWSVGLTSGTYQTPEVRTIDIDISDGEGSSHVSCVIGTWMDCIIGVVA